MTISCADKHGMQKVGPKIWISSPSYLGSMFIRRSVTLDSALSALTTVSFESVSMILLLQPAVCARRGF